MKAKKETGGGKAMALVLAIGGLDIEKDHHGAETVWPMDRAVKLVKACRAFTGQRHRVAKPKK